MENKTTNLKQAICMEKSESDNNKILLGNFLLRLYPEKGLDKA